MITRQTSRSNLRQTMLHHAQSIPLPEDSDNWQGHANCARLSEADEWPEHHAKLSEGRKGSDTDSLTYIKVRLHEWHPGNLLLASQQSDIYHLVQLKRNQAWVPAGPKNILKFVAWDTGKEQFHNSPKDRLQARIMVFLVEKLEVRPSAEVMSATFMCTKLAIILTVWHTGSLRTTKQQRCIFKVPCQDSAVAGYTDTRQK